MLLEDHDKLAMDLLSCLCLQQDHLEYLEGGNQTSFSRKTATRHTDTAYSCYYGPSEGIDCCLLRAIDVRSLWELDQLSHSACLSDEDADAVRVVLLLQFVKPEDAPLGVMLA